MIRTIDGNISLKMVEFANTSRGITKAYTKIQLSRMFPLYRESTYLKQTGAGKDNKLKPLNFTLERNASPPLTWGIN